MSKENDRRVRSWCPECGKVVPATLTERDGDLHLRRHCPQHSRPETLFWKNARLYKPFPPSGDEMLPEGRLTPFDPRLDRFITTLAIDLTGRCNLACPACFARSVPSDLRSPPPPDLTMREILDLIPDYRGRKRKPGLSLLGGEPTLRDDLPELIAAVIREKGLMPRLVTNGVILGSGDLLKRIREAGLRWIMLQFDGLRPETSQALRGTDLTKMKIALMDKIAEQGMAVHLSVMVKKGVNDREVGDILRFAAANPAVRRVSFYPCSATGRLEDGPAGGEVTHVEDVLNSIEEGTGGRILRNDILSAKALAGVIFKATGLPMFRPRPCLFPFLLFRRNGDLLPCNRFFTLRGILADPGGFTAFLQNGLGLLDQYEGRFSSDFLFVSIEKFYDDHTFLADAARNCHHLYLTPQGILPFCVYNSCLRNRGAST